MKTNSTIKAIRRLLTLTVTTALLALAGPAVAQGQEFGVAAFDGAVSADPAGSAFTQAGGTPYEVSTAIDFNVRSNPDVIPPEHWPAEPVKDIVVDLPAGLVGDPTGVQRCSLADLAGTADSNGLPVCAVSSQVGVVAIRANLAGVDFPLPNDAVYALEAPPGTAARLGMNLFGTLVVLDAKVRSDGDYGVTIVSRNTSEGLALTSTRVTIWGVPSDPRHDERRLCVDPSSGTPTKPCASQAPQRSFLRMPTACTPAGQGLVTGLRIDSWFDPGDFKSASFESHLPPGLLSSPPEQDPGLWGAPQGPTGCDQVPFDPQIDIQPTTSAPDSPSGLDVRLSVPQTDDPDEVGHADLKRAVVTLPEGMSVNPSSADGLGACTSAQVALDSTGPAHCPDSSKIGTVVIETPLLDDPLEGAVHLAAQGDNPFGSLLALYIVAEGQGVVVKLPGRVDTDPVTGRLTTTFDNQPQLPFSELRLKLKTGPRAPLATPTSCGVKSIAAELEGWNGKSVTRTDSFDVDCQPGLGGFAPAFRAGTTNPTGGAHSGFVMRLDRADGQQVLRNVTLELPQGLLAKLAGVTRCADVSGCPASSRVGTATVGAGTGSNPFYLPGQPVYLTGPYKGAPFGLAVVARVVAGPLDLGTVIVRQALHIDRTDASATVVSDPLPTILEGIPLKVRSVNVDVDRSNFIVNPTSCAPKLITATLGSLQGRTAKVASRFQATDCRALAFTPRFGMRLTGRRQMRSGGHPGIRTTVTQRAGQAGIGAVEVRLPSSLALDPDRAASDSLCGWRESLRAEPACPASSVIGSARAVSPLLGEPLEGPVYFAKRKRINRFGREISTFPSLVVALRGEVAINLRGNTTVKPRSLTTTFAQVPDAPISRFQLNLSGASKGILLVTRTSGARRIDLCKRRQIAEFDVDGQNGRRADQLVRLKTACGKASKAKRAKRKAGR
jgi:hypothetical protein